MWEGGLQYRESLSSIDASISRVPASDVQMCHALDPVRTQFWMLSISDVCGAFVHVTSRVPASDVQCFVRLAQSCTHPVLDDLC